MLDFTEAEVEGLKSFTKAAFDVDEIVDAARELKYTTRSSVCSLKNLTVLPMNLSNSFKRVYEGDGN